MELFSASPDGAGTEKFVKSSNVGRTKPSKYPQYPRSPSVSSDAGLRLAARFRGSLQRPTEQLSQPDASDIPRTIIRCHVHAVELNNGLGLLRLGPGRANFIHSVLCACLAAHTSSAKEIARSSCFDGWQA